MFDFMEHAMRYAAMGWDVMPLRGKFPVTEHGSHDATSDATTIKRWGAEHPHANVGLATGKRFWVLDIDTKTGGDYSLEELEEKNGKLPPTIQQQTGTGGKHFLFFPPNFSIKNSTGKVAPGIDVRGIGGYIVAAPSIHPDTGKEYVWDGMDEIEKQRILPAPAWLLALVHEPERVNAPVVPAKIPKGQQHSTLVSIAGTMRNRGLEFQEIFAALRVINDGRCAEPGPVENIRKIADSVCRYPAGRIAVGAGSAVPQEITRKAPAKPVEPGPEFHTPGQIISAAGGLLAYLESKNRRGVLTPWAALNRTTGGFHPGELIVLAAATSKGKTAFSLNIALHVARQKKTAVSIFSMEMSESEVNDRLLCLAGPLDSQILRRRVDENAIERAADTIADLPLFIMDHSACTVKLIHDSVSKLKAEQAVDLVVVDYLQLMASTRRYGTRAEEVGALSRGLKRSAQALQIPFLVLSQLNRSSGREKRFPELFDLRESGSIENDANVVLFLHSQQEYKDAPVPVVPIDLIIAKQRNGPSGIRLPMVFRVNSGRFEE